ncbi:hypothetical protein LTR29_014071 [Friedmanniomyces endolithicus]|nr:hypothetical protein LTR29_014071 [Friedmanniomyces endolithicus]
MPPKLEQAFVFRLFENSSDTLSLGPNKGGALGFVYPFSSGFLKGSSIDAKMVNGGSDLFTLDPATGMGYTNVQVSFKSVDAQTGKSDGIFVMTYRGVLKVDELFQLALSGSPEAKTTSSEDHYCVANVTFEVSDERHKWMEQTLFVGHGHAYVPGDGSAAAEYEVYKVV